MGRFSEFRVKSIGERWFVLAGIGLLGAIALAGVLLAIYAAWLFHDLPDAGELRNTVRPRPRASTRATAP